MQKPAVQTSCVQRLPSRLHGVPSRPHPGAPPPAPLAPLPSPPAPVPELEPLAPVPLKPPSPEPPSGMTVTVVVEEPPAKPPEELPSSWTPGGFTSSTRSSSSQPGRERARSAPLSQNHPRWSIVDPLRYARTRGGGAQGASYRQAPATATPSAAPGGASRRACGHGVGYAGGAAGAEGGGAGHPLRFASSSFGPNA
jgi:hypothetical protein